MGNNYSENEGTNQRAESWKSFLPISLYGFSKSKRFGF